MLTARVYADYNINAPQAFWRQVDIDDFEGCEFSTKFTAETSGDMEKVIVCVGLVTEK